MLNVIGVGDNVIEKYTQGKIMYPGGNVINFTVFAKHLGCASSYLGSFANDLPAMHIKDTLMTLGVDISRCKGYAGETRAAAVNIINGDRVFLNTPEDERGAKNIVKLTDDDLEFIKGFDLMHTDWLSYMEDNLPRIKAMGVPIIFDFSDKWDMDYLKRVCPHLFVSFLSTKLPDEEIEELLKQVVGFGSTLAIATMGDRGAMLYNGTRFYKRNAVRIKTIDTLGAGSAFLTSFTVKYIELLKEEEKSGELSIDMLEDLIEYALSEASFFAAKVTTKDGPFGFGIEYTDDDNADDVSANPKNGKKLVLGVIGADVHAVGNKILHYAFEQAGFTVYNLGVMVSQEEFVQAAIETEADAILVSSLYGHGELDCRGLREKCIEAGLSDIILYVGGNLVVGKVSFDDVERKFKAMGFDRVYSNSDPLEKSIGELKSDLGISVGEVNA